MRLYNDVIQESQLVYGDHAEHLNINSTHTAHGECSFGGVDGEVVSVNV